MRKFVVLLAVVGATVAVVLTQTSVALMSREQQCEKQSREATLWSGMNLRYDGQRVVDGVQKQPDGGISNDADQYNGKLCQEAKNEPHAWVDNDNINKNPQFTLVGSNDSSNSQSNDTWIEAASANGSWRLWPPLPRRCARRLRAPCWYRPSWSSCAN